MNKALHVFVYLFLIGVGAALWYEFQLNDKRGELRDRNKLLEDYIVKHYASQVEDGAKYAAQALPADQEVELDVDDPFNPAVTMPKTETVIGKIKQYNFTYEETVHDSVTWGPDERTKLRDAFIIDSATGKPKIEGANRVTEGSVADKLLDDLDKKFDAQKEQFRKTREAIPALRGKIVELVGMYNELTPHLRAYIQTNINQVAEIKTLNEQKQALEAEKVKMQGDITALREKTEALKIDLDNAQEETLAVRDDLEKQVKMVEALKKQVQTLLQQQQTIATKGTIAGATAAISSLPFGDKGTIIEVDNEGLLAIVKFTPEAMKQLKGPELEGPLPMIELAVKREGFEGPANELVGRIRLRQEVVGKPFIRCDILQSWKMDDIKVGDTVFSVKD